MKLLLLVSVSCSFVYAILSNPLVRSKREVGGALDIVTNHAQPIHEDVKPETPDTPAKVLTPHDVLFEGKPLRRSAPLSNKLELVRSTNRVVTLFVLLVSAIIEFYPMLRHLYDVLSFMDLY